MSEESSDDENWEPKTDESVSSETVSESVSEIDTEEASQTEDSHEKNHSAINPNPRSPEICHRPGEGGDNSDIINSHDVSRRSSSPISNSPPPVASDNAEEANRSISGAINRLLDPWILSFFVIIIAGFLALPFKALIKLDNTPALELEQFNFRRSTFTTHYKPQLTQRDQNLIFAVVDRQRDVNPPQRPAVFLLMTPALTDKNLDFANDLGRLARGQDVKAIQSQQVQTRTSLMDELTKSFRDDKGAIIEHFEKMPSDAALAFYGITDENAVESSKNKTIVILFEDAKAPSKQVDKILLDWMKEKGIDTKLNRGLISRIAENVIYLV